AGLGGGGAGLGEGLVDLAAGLHLGALLLDVLFFLRLDDGRPDDGQPSQGRHDQGDQANVHDRHLSLLVVVVRVSVHVRGTTSQDILAPEGLWGGGDPSAGTRPDGSHTAQPSSCDDPNPRGSFAVRGLVLTSNGGGDAAARGEGADDGASFGGAGGD